MADKSPMIKQKVKVVKDQWLKGLNSQLNKPTTQYSVKVFKVVSQANE